MSESSVTSRISEKKHESVVSRDGISSTHRKVEFSDIAGELMEMLKKERKRSEEMDIQLQKLRNEIRTIGGDKVVDKGTIAAQDIKTSHRQRFFNEAISSSGIPQSQFQPLVPPLVEPTITENSMIIDIPGKSYSSSPCPTYYPSYPMYVSVPVGLQYYVPCQQHIQNSYNPHHDPRMYPMGVIYTLKFRGNYKKESLDDTEKMFAYFLLGEGHTKLSGIHICISVTEDEMKKGYTEDNPRMIAFARAAYSTFLWDERPVKEANKSLPTRELAIYGTVRIVNAIGTFCRVHGGLSFGSSKNIIHIIGRTVW